MQTIEMETKLSSLLKEATLSVHGRVEGGDFIKKIFSGTITHIEYAQYVWAMNETYTALELNLFKLKQHQSIKPIIFEEIFRLEALSQDMKTWNKYMPTLKEDLVQATNEYAQYLSGLAMQDPTLLVAHAYVRYLGDLSGGQVIAKVLKHLFQSEQGLAFYDFPLIANVADMKMRYRQGLDTIGYSHPHKVAQLCDEAILAFEFNGKIFTALSSSGVK